jgi:hypothetical protein
MNLFRFVPGYESAIYESGREPALAMLIAFLITFVLTREFTTPKAFAEHIASADKALSLLGPTPPRGHYRMVAPPARARVSTARHPRPIASKRAAASSTSDR